MQSRYTPGGFDERCGMVASDIDMAQVEAAQFVHVYLDYDVGRVY